MSEKEKTAGRLLEEQLTFCFPHIGKEAPGQIEEAAAFCEGYKAFLNEGKTERECVEAAVKRLEAAGYTAVDFTKQYQPGEPIVWNGQVIVSCFDLVTGPDKVNTKHDKPFTLAKLSLE